MDSEEGKLFIGGISFQTTEERLKDYFSMFGEVREAEIKKDRITGQPRGFGFIVFADPAVAERVLFESLHNIDGRMVEVKKSISRDGQRSIRRNTVGNDGQIQSRTKKIFVGGLPPTVTEIELRKYFEQFGTVTDVVVMYDPRTLRPRGFGFIVYESEDAVDNVARNPFHQLHGKAVEVKRSIPKELIPSRQIRLPTGRGGNFGAGNGLGFNSNRVPPMNSNGVAMGGEGGYSSYGPTGYNVPNNGAGAGYGPPISGGGYGNATFVNNTPSYGTSSYGGASISYGGPVACGAGNAGYGNNAATDASSNIWCDPAIVYVNTGSSVEYGGPGSGSERITHHSNGSNAGYRSTGIQYASTRCDYAAQNNG